jgi:hypothetical protein
MQLEPRERTPSGAPLKAPAGEDEKALEPRLRCGVCEVAVASPQDRVERFGAHVHERMNPSGFTFVIGCFSRAEGVMEIGEESHEFPWFPRHVWCCVACASCGAHLGWRFSCGGDAFVGLILDRLLG